MKKIIHFVVFLLFLFAKIAAAQSVNLEWSSKYDGPYSDTSYIRGIKVDQSGNIYVISVSKTDNTKKDFLTIKYNSSGIKLWEKNYNGLFNSDDFICKIALDKFDNIYVSGNSYEESGNRYTTTIKYDTDGNLLWIEKKLSSGYLYGLYIDNNNYIYVLNSSILIKYNSEGQEQLIINLFSTTNINAIDIATDKNDNIYVVGDKYVAEKNTDILVCKYDKKGNFIWSRQYDGKPNLSYSWDRPEFIKIDNDSNVYVIGQSIGTYTGWDIVSLKYNSFGNLLWENRFSGIGDENHGGDQDLPDQAVLDKNGDLIICGESGNNNPSYDFAVLKYNSNGKLLWSRFINNGWAYDLNTDENNNIYVTGSTYYDFDNWKSECITVKYNSDGERLWYESFRENNIYGKVICLDNNKNVIIAGILSSDYSAPNLFFQSMIHLTHKQLI